MIDWPSFTWEAFATLSTGFAAVTGAFVLGRRQLDISRQQTASAARQNEILERQLRLAELAYRHALFDRRMEVYVGIRDYLVDIMREAKPPTGETALRFHNAMSAARFVFSAEVNEKLEQLRLYVLDYRVLTLNMKAVIEQKGPWRHNEPQQESDMLEQLSEHLRTLPDLFGDEIRLGL